MAKRASKIMKVRAVAGKATPAPPLGTQLGPTGINIGDFCSKFNDATKDRAGELVPVEISIYEDRSFDFILKTPPASFLIKKAAGVEKGSGKNLVKRAGKITKQQVQEIAKIKMEDLNARELDEASAIIAGTARSMGIDVQ